MKPTFYPRLAWMGIKKNARLYVPYLLSCAFMAAMLYVIAYLAVTPALYTVNGKVNGSGTSAVAMTMSLGSFVVSVFIALFLFYTNSFLLRRRKKEFGLYSVLGMDRGALSAILFWETLLAAAFTLIAGLGLGLLLSYVSQSALLRLLSLPAAAFTVSLAAIKQCAITFIAIFALLYVRGVLSLRHAQGAALLKSENVGEKPPKANWLFAFAGAVILAGAYYLAVKIIDPTTAMLVFFLAVVMVIIATYLLFIAGSVALCKLLQKSKKYYYKTRHFVSLSQMVYRMKRNGAGLASICILSTMVLVTISSTMCIYADTESSIRNRYPHDITIEWSGKTSLPQNEDGTDTELKDSVVQRLTPEMTMTYKEAVEKVLESHKVKAENLENYNLYSLSGVQSDDVLSIDFEKMKGEISSINAGMSGSVKTMYFTTMDDYNKLKGTDKTLAEDEMMLYSYKTDYEYDSFTIDGVGTWKVETMKEPPIGVGNAMANMQAICERYVPSVKAYLLVPLIGSLFADFLNSLVITFFINFL